MSTEQNPRPSHFHPPNGAARAEGPNQQRLEHEMTLIKIALENQQTLRSIEDLLKKLLAQGQPPASPGPLFDKPTPPETPDSAPVGVTFNKWLNWKPKKTGTPLAALDLTDAAKNAIQGLPFPVNSVEDLTSRTRAVDILAVRFAGKFTIKDIKQSLQTGGYPALLPDDYVPPPPPDDTNFKLVLELLHGAEKGRTVDQLAADHSLPVARVITLLDQAGPIWNENPHHIAYWAKKMGWVPQEGPPRRRKRKAKGVSDATG